jgi:hypothetical protein
VVYSRRDHFTFSSGPVWLQKRPVTSPKIRPEWRGYCAFYGMTIVKKGEENVGLYDIWQV